MWIGTDKGVTRLSEGAWTTFGRDTLIDGVFVDSVVATPSGIVWAGNSNSISWFDGEWHAEGGQGDAPPSEGSGLYGTPLIGAPDGGVWAIQRRGSGGPANHAGGKWTPAPVLPEGCTVITSMAVTPDGTLWIGTADCGLVRFDGTEWKRHSRGLESDDWDQWGPDDIQSLTAAPDGSIYVGTDRGGIARFRSDAWEDYRGFENEVVIALDVAPDGQLWAGTLQAGVLRFDGDEWTRWTHRDGLADDRVWAIEVDESGVVWMATEAGISRFVSQG